ncbi:hypothetical protein ACKWTF_012949 [Chironomus riparius]
MKLLLQILRSTLFYPFDIQLLLVVASTFIFIVYCKPRESKGVRSKQIKKLSVEKKEIRTQHTQKKAAKKNTRKKQKIQKNLFKINQFFTDRPAKTKK